MSGAPSGPLSGLRVIEMGHALAGPLAATFLGDFGAEVLKIEPPGAGDSLRAMGPKLGTTGTWWLVVGRNKKSMTLNLKAPEGLEVARALIRDADVLVENYRPGTLEKLGLGWPALQALNPRLVLLRISGFGQTGPYSLRPGFGKIAEAISGATNLTGRADEAPLHPGYSLGDATCALTGAYGVTLALLARHASGKGQMVDLALYEPLFRLIDWQIPMHVLNGTKVMRAGTSFPFQDAFVTDICRTRDNQNIVVSAATATHRERLVGLLIRDGAMASFTSTAALGEALRTWIGRNDRDAALRKLQEADLVAGLVYTPADMLQDEHMKARRNIVEVEDPKLGTIPMPNVVPLLSDTPGAVRWTGPALGQHTEEILGSLRYSAGQIADFRARKIV